MVAYAFALVLIGGAYASLAFLGRDSALLFGLAALACVLAAIILTVLR
ncbi:hypothetical protein Rxycam_01060 [Rubrobacter xylanophilus DSM 9941]|nr:hypothetical protein Rxycam_01060 [Rubrobacter xylanophilus DSM 9941]